MRAACLPWLPAVPWPADAATAQRGQAGTAGGECGHGTHLQGPPHPLPQAVPSSCVPSLQSSCPPAPGAAGCVLCSAALLSSPQSPALASAQGRRRGWTWALVGELVVPWPQESRWAPGGHWWRGAVYAGVLGVLGGQAAGVQAALPLSMCCLTPPRSQSPSPGHSPWASRRLCVSVLSPLLLPPLPPHSRQSPLPTRRKP